MSKVERIVAKSSFGSKTAQAARASVAPERASRVVASASQREPRKTSLRRDTK